MADRVSYVRRGPAGAPVLEATYSYFDNGLVQSILFGNGTMTWYEYDAANRVTEIDHRDPLDVSLLTYTYTYRKDNLVKQIDDLVAGSTPKTTYFLYDDRGRHTLELRNAGGQFIQYAYDEGGNRITKTDDGNDIRVDYVYDISDPAGYGSANNRLMSYKTWDFSPGFDILLSETFYYYNCSGNPTNIVTRKIHPILPPGSATTAASSSATR